MFFGVLLNEALIALGIQKSPFFGEISSNQF